MSPEVAEVEAVETPEVAAEQQDRELDVTLGASSEKLIETTHKKGKTAGQLAYFLKVNLEGSDPFAAIRTAVGKDNFNRAILAEVVRPACNDATHDALSEVDEKNVEFTTALWAAKFVEQFIPGARRSGVGIKQLREKQMEIFNELNPFIVRLAKGESLSQDENNRYLTLLVDYQELSEKIEKSARKGKGKKAVKK